MTGIHLKAYEDELCYSLFARYYLHSGYLTYRSAAEDLYINPNAKPNIELCNLLTPLCQDQFGSPAAFICEHTIFNYYNAFLPPEKQAAVWNMALAMDIKKLSNALPIPKSKYVRYLRYCPVCVSEDRCQYGEAYWHRSHQLYGISVCHKHGCRLLDSDNPISSNGSPALITAEESIADLPNSVEMADSIEIRLAKYAAAILNTYATSQTPIGDYLHYRLRGTKYLSARGAKRYVATMANDLCEYYKNVDLLGFGQDWQLEKIFNNQRFNSFEICLVGLFLGISPDELIFHNNVCNEKCEVGEFDKKVAALNQQGLNYRQIAKTLGMSYDYCKAIGNGRRGKYHYLSGCHKEMRKCTDWQALDRQMLPSVKKLVNEMMQLGDTRPQKVSIGRVERLVGLKEAQLTKLNACTAYIQSHTISQEEFWAFTIAWAIYKLKKEQQPIHPTNIYNEINIRKRDIKRAFPYLYKFLDYNIVAEIAAAFQIA